MLAGWLREVTGGVDREDGGSWSRVAAEQQLMLAWTGMLVGVAKERYGSGRLSNYAKDTMQCAQSVRRLQVDGRRFKDHRMGAEKRDADEDLQGKGSELYWCLYFLFALEF